MKGLAEPDESEVEEKDELINQYRTGELHNGELDKIFFRDEYNAKLHHELLQKRNIVMAGQAIDLIRKNPDTSYFFAFGVGHFVASSKTKSILDIVREEGFQVRHILNQ